MGRVSFFKTKEFKIFISVWIIILFYLQMYGNSCMANSNSALTASIVNEGRFEIDNYHKASCDKSFYKGHYYSGMVPGISFITSPLYSAGKIMLSPIQDETMNLLFQKLQSYNSGLASDFSNDERDMQSYFPTLSKRQIVEHLIISTFILPVFTTSLFVAISVVLVYMLLKYFTKDEKTRMLITLLYAFGTLMFPVATEFFQRPIAITLMLVAFLMAFRIKYHHLKTKPVNFFSIGLLAGISVWFDYFHGFIAGLLFLYLLTFTFNQKNKKLSLIFLAGFVMPILLLMLYHYSVFDNPFSTPYKYRVIVDFHVALKDIKFPTPDIIFRMFEFFIYSPIIIVAIFSLFIAISKKDQYYHESIGTLILLIMTFVYASAIAIMYPSFMPTSHKRYMEPVVPYLMVFSSYIFNYLRENQKKKNNKKPSVYKGWFFIIVAFIAIISVFFNWTSAQFGGHSSLTQFDLEQKKFITGIELFTKGPSSSFLRTLAGFLGINTVLLNVAGLIILALIIWLIWRKDNPIKR